MWSESVNIQFCEQTTLIQSKTNTGLIQLLPFQHVCKMFQPYLGHHLACQHKNHTKEDTF